jgi:hypothetical protein
MAEKKENRLAFRVSDAMLEKFKELGVAYKIKKSQPLFEALVERASARSTDEGGAPGPVEAGNYEVLPATKAAVERMAAASKVSAGEVIDRAVALYAGGGKAAGLLEARVVYDSQVFEKRAAGAQVVVAESALASGERLSPYLKAVAQRMGERLGIEPMLALDTIAGWFEDVFEDREAVGMAEAVAGEVVGIGDAEEAQVTSSMEPNTSPEDLGQMWTFTCAHCGEVSAGRKGSTMCVVCGQAGHYGDARDCRKCGEAQAL